MLKPSKARLGLYALHGKDNLNGIAFHTLICLNFIGTCLLLNRGKRVNCQEKMMDKGSWLWNQVKI